MSRPRRPAGAPIDRSVGVGAELSAVLASWATDPSIAELTLQRMGEVAVRFARYAIAHQVESLTQLNSSVCSSFIDAPTRTGVSPTANTRHFRRTTIRTMLRTLRRLGVDANDPTIDVELPARDGTLLRALSDDENTLCRTTTFYANMSDLRRPTAWALAETTATTGEISQLATTDVHDTGTEVMVDLPGGRGAYSRTVTATEWAAQIIRRRIGELNPGDPLVYNGTRPAGSGAAQAAVCNLISVVLHTNGLHVQQGIRPASVRLWRARTVFVATGSLEAAARLLGTNSLDQLARQLDHDWQR